ncbi:transglycosylase SLT domain-containing protein [Nocardia vinacea]|uniref:aggregation-promoting factor C-terminal-like domain-containing protein n=1 Tax=Nocardia vinacea TaxID=96468 RepID=UPI00343AFFF4
MLRVVAAAIAVSALMVCAGPAVAEGLGDSVVTFADSVATPADGPADSGPTSADELNDSAATSANSPSNSAAAAADGLGEGGSTSADRLNDRVTPSANGPDDSFATPTNGPSESDSTPADRLNGSTTTPANAPDNSAATSADSLGETSSNGLDDSLATSAEESDNTAPADETDDDIAVTPAASPPDSTTTVGLALSLVRLGTRALALTVVPLHQFPAFDAVITHESGWDVFAINPKSGAYGLGQALPAEKMQTHGADWRFNPLTQIRWTYDYMNARYGSPDGAWAFWQEHHWY